MLRFFLVRLTGWLDLWLSGWALLLSLALLFVMLCWNFLDDLISDIHGCLRVFVRKLDLGMIDRLRLFWRRRALAC